MTTDIDAIHALLARSRDAWRRGDGTAYAACFTTDATDVTYTGTVYRGAAEIGRVHQELFDSFLKGTRLWSEVLDIHRHGPDTAVVVTAGESAPPRPRRRGRRGTYTLVRAHAGEWGKAAMQKPPGRGGVEG
ncbi:SgcJ/EcaC family oxidoreductase, partial [Nocardia farcinica]|uniref:SgcJ/EcaC family oxidoreductase n=1 Tax=Nocardia farcinica TaxID=37329 RepID=UPI002456148E